MWERGRDKTHYDPLAIHHHHQGREAHVLFIMMRAHPSQGIVPLTLPMISNLKILGLMHLDTQIRCNIPSRSHLRAFHGSSIHDLCTWGYADSFHPFFIYTGDLINR